MTQYGDLRRLGYFDGTKTEAERAKILAGYDGSSADRQTSTRADQQAARRGTTPATKTSTTKRKAAKT